MRFFVKGYSAAATFQAQELMDEKCLTGCGHADSVAHRLWDCPRMAAQRRATMPVLRHESARRAFKSLTQSRRQQVCRKCAWLYWRRMSTSWMPQSTIMTSTQTSWRLMMMSWSSSMGLALAHQSDGWQEQSMLSGRRHQMEQLRPSWDHFHIMHPRPLRSLNIWVQPCSG